MNQVEQWFSILQRKRWRLVDFASKAELGAKIAIYYGMEPPGASVQLVNSIGGQDYGRRSGQGRLIFTTFL
jgi:hypothetical protein